MANNYIQVPPDSTGNKVDTSEITVGSDSVNRQRIVIADDTTAAAVAPVSATDGLTVNLGTNNDVTVTGTITANAGTDLDTSALALESGGNLDTIASPVATISATPLQRVAIFDNSDAQITTFGGGTQYGNRP